MNSAYITVELELTCNAKHFVFRFSNTISLPSPITGVVQAIDEEAEVTPTEPATFIFYCFTDHLSLFVIKNCLL